MASHAMAQGRMFVLLISAWVLVTGLLMASQAALAAVRICQDLTVSEATGLTEATARKKALEGWQAQVARFGPAYSAWRLAAERDLKCVKYDGQFVCRAVGRPCTVEQVPPDPGKKGVKRLDI